MAKQAILDVLKSTIGKYVRNLDAESLNVAVWNGKLELFSLELDIGAVNSELDRQAAEAPNLALPFRVIGGGFESLQVDVPWARITSRPVVLRAKGLQMTVEPCDRLSQLDPLIRSDENVQKRIKKAKEERIHSIKIYNESRMQSNAFRKLAEVEEEEDSSGSNKSTFTSRLVRRIVENLQVEIDNVQITFKNSDCSAGVVLKSLSLVTTTKHGARTFVDRTVKNSDEDSFLYKVLSINGFGIYLDDHRTNVPFPINETGSTADIEKKNKDHSYILSPLSFEAKLRQSDNMKCIDYPKYLLSSELSKLSIELTRDQLENMAKIRKVISSPLASANILFPQYRPLSRISRSTAREWWQYAFRCVRRLSGKRMWVEFFDAYQKRKTYIPLYKRHAHSADCAWIPQLTKEEQSQLEKIELDRSISVNGLMAWRNVADAQAELEMKKHDATKKKTKKSYYASFFGSSGAKSTGGDEEDESIKLTEEEIRALEAISKEQTANLELSNDSRLCDLKFIWKAFEISLVNKSRELVNLRMGTVITSFNANADGSFQSNFSLASMEVWDVFTPKTFFETVLRNLPPEDVDGSVSNANALDIRFEKSKTGDREVSLKLVAFEMIASPLLILEVRKFLDVSRIKSPHVLPNNPLLLQQTISGSVDLFFDAQSGEASGVVGSDGDEAGVFSDGDRGGTSTQAVSDQISNAMLEAWKSKTKDKVSLKVDCDIHAPLLIMPRDCAKFDSPALIFDFGHAKFTYGKTDQATLQVQNWCREQAKAQKSVFQLDGGSLELTNLTFCCGKVMDIVNSEANMKSTTRADAVIEPVSAKLDLGIMTYAEDEAPSICMFGVFPSLCLRMAPTQTLALIQVLTKWQQIGREIGFISQDADENGVTILEEEEIETPTQHFSSNDGTSAKEQSQNNGVRKESTDEFLQDKPQKITFHLVLSLQVMSSYFHRDSGDGIECHLVSVRFASSQMIDGSTSSRLCMGWFWILDMLETQSPRWQRLVAHSNLPRSATEMANDQNFDVLKELRQQGAFDEKFSSASDLADITYTQPCLSTQQVERDVYSASNPLQKDSHPGPILEGKFTSLFIHWNPPAIKMIANAYEDITKTMQTLSDSTGTVQQRVPPSSKQVKEAHPNDNFPRLPTLILARMEKFEICLNSAIDDLPLYYMTMSDTSVAVLLEIGVDNLDVLLSLELGDVRTTTSSNCLYQTLLGLAPNHSESLLSVTYCQGPKALVSRSQNEGSRCEALCDITLSPMRLVYIHSQVMTLVDYATEGILGAIFHRAASSAASAAIEIASFGEKSNKVFNLKAVGFDVILPQSALSKTHFLLHAADLVVKYIAFPDPGGGTADISLGELSLRDSSAASMVEKPIHMGIFVRLNPYGLGTLDDQAMRVDMHISKASFVVTKHQYEQIMYTLSQNIGETETYLRGKASKLMVQDRLVDPADGRSSGFKEEAPITHAGMREIEKVTRIYSTLAIEILSLELCGQTTDESILYLSAVKTQIKLDLITDKRQMITEICLHDLLCNDVRTKAVGRQFRSLVQQCKDTEVDDKDLFLISYLSDQDKQLSETKLTVGSPRFVFIPDVIAEVLSFLSYEKPEINIGPDESPVDLSRKSTTAVEFTEGASGMEVSTVREIETYTVQVETSDCQIVVIDMGSTLSSGHIGSSSMVQATESVVMQGKIQCDLEYQREVPSGDHVKTRMELHGKQFEIYTAHSRELREPLQIMEPASFVAFYTHLNQNLPNEEVELRAVGLSDIDLTLSMQNIALMTAISASIAETMEEKADDKSDVEERVPLSDHEVARLQKLADALEDDSVSVGTLLTGNNSDYDSSVGSGKPQASISSGMTISRWKTRITIPESEISIINDLQGMDEPLFRLGASNIVGGLEGSNGMFMSRIQPTFEGSVNCTLSADYFDPAVNLWKRLLLKPWEVTIKGNRGVSRRFTTNRLSTSLDIESFPCFVAFSEQFLVSLNAANTMWSIYSKATLTASQDVSNTSLQLALAASAARNMVTSLPYGIENHCGVEVGFAKLQHDHFAITQSCKSGSAQYFRFDPPAGKGYGGKRLYGQEVARLKSVRVYIGDEQITIEHIDAEMGRPKVFHQLKKGWIVVTHVTKSSKSLVLHVGSHVDLVNKTFIPFDVSVECGDESRLIGTCGGSETTFRRGKLRRTSVFSSGVGATLSNKSDRFGVPVDFLTSQRSSSLIICPRIPTDCDVFGYITIPSTSELMMLAEEPNAQLVFEVACTGKRQEGGGAPLPDPFVVLTRLNMRLVGLKKHPMVEISLEPRATLKNKMPLNLTVKTPMPHTFTASDVNGSGPSTKVDKFEVSHFLAPNDSMEVFTPGPSFAVSIKCTDMPVSGGTTSWMKGGWVDLPMMNEFRLPGPLTCSFPFVKPKEADSTSIITGSDFFLLEADAEMSEKILEQIESLSSLTEKKSTRPDEGIGDRSKGVSTEAMRSYLATVSNYGVDHTGNLIFEQVPANSGNLRGSALDVSFLRNIANVPTATPFSSFASEQHGYRLSLLPTSKSLLRVLELTMDAAQGIRRSLPFRIEDVSICEGGIDSTALFWEDSSPSGYFVYRTLVNSYQSELHVIPEFIVYNGSKAHTLVIRQVGAETRIGPEKMSQVKKHPKMGLVITLDYKEFGGRAGPIQVDDLRHRVVIVKSLGGQPLGSVAIQTVIGSRDSKLVVKVGGVQFSQAAASSISSSSESLFSRDLVRMRVRWSEFNITLNEARPLDPEDESNKAFFESALDRLVAAASDDKKSSSLSIFSTKKKVESTWMAARQRRNQMAEQEQIENVTQRPVCTFALRRFTVDWQRIFKEDELNQPKRSGNPLLSPERSQLSVIIHHVQILDKTHNTDFPLVFDSSSAISFIDLCIRCRGSLNEDLVKVDLFDLNLAHANGKSEKIIVNTSEDFMWKMLDLADRILVATAEMAGIDIKLEWDEDGQQYYVTMQEALPSKAGTIYDRPTTYTPPPSDRLYDVARARVSPFTVIVSFKRRPQSSRYKLIRDIRGARLMNYFTRRLKFTLDKAELKFARYHGKEIKGPPSRLVEILLAVYASRLKMKIVSILSATSIQDWKYLASRDDGDDEFAEGDLLRATGHLAGRTAGYVFKKVGYGLGDGIDAATSYVGDGIEAASSKVGAEAVGAGVNSVVTGLGGGVGSTVKGVGYGAGKLFKGAGKGVGQMVGGVTGAVLIAGKGIGKGVTTGDGQAVLTGFAEGGQSMATGVGQGVETAVMGAADGVLTVGKGVFSGVKSIGRGFGGAFSKGKKKPPKR